MAIHLGERVWRVAVLRNQSQVALQPPQRLRDSSERNGPEGKTNPPSLHPMAPASEKSHRNLLSTLNDQSKKIEEATLTLNDMEGAKRKIAAENTDLLRQLQVMENSANMLSMLKLTLADQLDKARAVAENEALGEADMLRVRYEKEGVAKAEELEMAKLKMQACLPEADSTADQLKAKQFDRIVGKWKGKVDSIGMDLDSAQKETRNPSSELFGAKSGADEFQRSILRSRSRSKGTCRS